MKIDAGPATTLAAGLLTYAGAWGIGAAVMRLARLTAPDEIRAAASPVLGLAILGLVVEFFGMAGAASRSMLLGIWAALAIIGLISVTRARLDIDWGGVVRSPLAAALVALAALSMVLALVAALAPSSKIDETYYHMLVARRIVEDGGLRFYRLPIEAAVLPQMLFQIAMAPLWALGIPGAANVVSWSLSVTLLVFAWRFVSRVQRDTDVAAACVLVLACLPYVTVWHTTAGSHAFGDVAMALAVVSAARVSRSGGADGEGARWLALVSALAACGAAAKLSSWPLAVVVTAFAAWRVAERVSVGRTVAVAAVPWLMLIGPIALWTWLHSGSPLGPVGTGVFGSTAYAPNETQAVFAAMRAENRWQRAELVNFVALYSPLLWIGALMGLRSNLMDRSTRRVLAACAIGQLALVLALLPHEARFLGGLPVALFVIAAASVPLTVADATPGRRAAAFAALTMPWLVFACYLGARSIPVVVGAERRDAYLDRYVAMAGDFRELDRRLPRDARLLVTGHAARIPSVYAPRPVYYDERDLPARASVYVVAVGATDSALAPRTLRLGRVVYEDSSAIVQVYRTIRRLPDRAPVRVYEARSVATIPPSHPADGGPRPPGR